MRIAFLQDIKYALSQKESFWLNLSILIYIAVLPFNVFGLDLFRNGRVIKFTEIALLFVVIFGTRAYLNGQIVIKKAPWFYAFLLLQFSIQFVSVVNSPIPEAGFDVAIAVASYSVLVIILFNVIRSESLLRAIMVVMGAAAVIVVMHSFAIYIMRGGIFMTREQPTILGNDIAGYFAYMLLMFGVGLVYVFFSEKNKKIRYVLWFFVALWLWVTILPAVKLHQIATLILLILLMVMLVGQRLKAFTLTFLFVVLLVFQLNIVPIKNKYLLAYNTITGGALDLKESEKQSQKLALLLEKKLTPKPEPVEVAVAPSAPEPAPATPAPAPEPSPPAPAPEPSPPLKEKHTFLIDEYSAENQVSRRWAGLFGRGSSVDVRMRGFMSGWLMGWSNPWTGIGAGQTPRVIDDYSKTLRVKSLDKDYLAWLPFREIVLSNTEFSPGIIGIYNIYLNAWAETGAIGLFAFLGILGTVIYKSAYVLRTTSDPEKRKLLCFLFALLVTVAGLVNMADITWVHPWLWTIIALTYAATNVNYGANQQMKGESTENMRIKSV